jgi:hypothetical protein
VVPQVCVLNLFLKLSDETDDRGSGQTHENSKRGGCYTGNSCRLRNRQESGWQPIQTIHPSLSTGV